MKVKLLMLFILIGLLVPSEAFSFIYDTGEPVPAGTPILSDENKPDYSFDFSQNLAAQFSLDQDYTITGLQGFMVVGDNFDIESTYNISIYGDGNDIPDVTNKIFSQERSRIFSTAEGYQWDGLTGLDLKLGSGTYWLAFESGQNNAFNGFMIGGAPNPLGNEAFVLQTGGPFDGIYLPSDDLNLGIRIDGRAVSQEPTVTPEPASLLLMGGGLMGAFYQRRQRRLA